MASSASPITTTQAITKYTIRFVRTVSIDGSPSDSKKEFIKIEDIPALLLQKQRSCADASTNVYSADNEMNSSLYRLVNVVEGSVACYHYRVEMWFVGFFGREFWTK